MLAVGGSFKETDIAMVDCVSSSTGMGEGVVVSGFLVAGEGVALFFVAGLGTLIGGSLTGDGALDAVGTNVVGVGEGTLLGGSLTGDGALESAGTDELGDGDGMLLSGSFTGDGALLIPPTLPLEAQPLDPPPPLPPYTQPTHIYMYISIYLFCIHLL